MPRFTLYSQDGTAYRADTDSMAMLQTWLYHWAPRLPKPLTLTVRPLYAGGEPDWPAGPQHYGSWREKFPVAADPEEIMEQIHRRREELEALG